MSLRYKNIFRKNIFSRSKAILLLLLILVSSIITLPILQSTNVGAANLWTGLGEDDMQIRSYLYYQAIKECFLKTTLSAPGNDKGINYKDIDTGIWFELYNPIISATGLGSYLVGEYGTSISPGQSGDVWCGQDADKLVLPALKIWGIGAAELLCNIGFKRKDVQAIQTIDECINDKNNNALITDLPKDERVKAFEKYMIDNVYINADPNALHAWQFFLLFRTTLQNSNCIPEISSRPPGEDKIDGWDDLIGRVYYPVKWVDEKGNLWVNNKDGSNDGTYRSIGRDKADFIWTVASDSRGRTCSELVTDMNKYAEDYHVWLEKKLAQNKNYKAPAGNNQTGTGGGLPTCSIDGIGWLICPVVRFLGHIADGAFLFLAKNFLQTDPGIFTNTNETLYKAWGAMRNVANIAFVIAFLIIIFSQLTSIGITNYGIKKLLPRLIIAAILVNLSYFICQIAVDISNILGWSLQSFFETIGTGVISGTLPTIGQEGNVFTTIAVDVVLLAAGGAIAYAALASFIPVVLAAIVGLVMILAILVVRQALVILLIVISPVAFVAFLLPNTLSWFTKWQKAFVAMLMLFPIIGLVYGASRLASGILTEVTQAGNNNSWFTEIAAAAVSVLPLFVVPGLLKKALDGVGNIGAKISGIGDKWGASAGKWGTSKYNDSALARGRAIREQAKANYKTKRFAKIIQAGGFKSKLARGFGFGEGGRAQKYAVTSSARGIVANAEAKDLAEEMQALEADVNEQGGKSINTKEYLYNVAGNTLQGKNQTDLQRKAAYHMLAKWGADDKLRQLKSTGKISRDKDKTDFQSAISANVGALLPVAPDLVKGGAAFNSLNGFGVSTWSAETAAAHMKHLDTLYANSIAPNATQKDIETLDNAINSFNGAIQDIHLTPTLQSNFKGEVGNMMLKEVGNINLAVKNRLNLTDINPEGKIR